jgi:hypothetical protein
MLDRKLTLRKDRKSAQRGEGVAGIERSVAHKGHSHINVAAKRAARQSCCPAVYCTIGVGTYRSGTQSPCVLSYKGDMIPGTSLGDASTSGTHRHEIRIIAPIRQYILLYFFYTVFQISDMYDKFPHTRPAGNISGY